MFAVIPLSASAQASENKDPYYSVDESGRVYEIRTSGEYEYWLITFDGEESAYICGYNGNAVNVTIPLKLDGHNIEGLWSEAFAGNTRIESVTVPGSLFIASRAFADCTSLKTINLSENVLDIESDCFDNTAWLNNQPDGVVYVGKVALKYKGTQPDHITIKDGTRAIADYATIGKKSITIPKSVIHIGSWGIGSNQHQPNAYSSIPGFIVYGVKGSVAEEYASQYSGLIFKPIGYRFSTPKITKLDNICAGVRLTIPKATGAPKYRVFYNNGKTWVKLGDTTTGTFIHKSAKSGKKYTYTVRVISKDGKTMLSDFNRTGWAKTFVAAPRAPRLRNTPRGVRLDFIGVPGNAKFRIFRKTGNGAWKSIAVVSKNARSFLDKTAKRGVTYRYTMRCMNMNGKFISSYNSGAAIRCKR